MPKPNTLTSNDRILLAASRLEETGMTPFRTEDLVVSSWQMFPNCFGLDGYKDLYPDANRVMSYVLGVRGLSTRGFLRKVAQKRYQLSRTGREHVLKIQGLPQKEKEPVKKEWSEFLSRVLESKAFTDMWARSTEGVIYSDAAEFWGYDPHYSTWGFIDDAKTTTTLLIQTIANYVNDGVDLVLLNGRAVSIEDLNILAETDRFLSKRFGKLLEIIRRKKEQASNSA